MAGFGWDDLLSIPTAGGYTALKQATGGATDVTDIGTGLKDFSNVGKNKFDAVPFNNGAPLDAPLIGDGHIPTEAWDHMGDNAQDIGASRGAQDWAIGQAQGAQGRGPQAWENQQLSDQEAAARGMDQSGALQLDREAAMGLAPSAAAYQMQTGLDTALANQQALAGGARGSAALGVAQGNMAGNAAQLQQGAFTQGGQLRAAEMAQARGQYGDEANAMRGQDQSRMQQGNQMAQFNAGLNDQYAMGMGGLGATYGGLTNQQQQTNQGYFNTGVGVAGNQAQLQGQTNELNSGNYNQAQALNAGVSQANADKSRADRDMWTSFVGQGIGMGGSAIPKPKG